MGGPEEKASVDDTRDGNLCNDRAGRDQCNDWIKARQTRTIASSSPLMFYTK
jgi:hypothetical protein